MKLRPLIARLLCKILNPAAIRSSSIHPTSKICSGSNVINVNMDRYSYIGNRCQVVNVNIGKFCSIADYCYIGPAMHSIKWVSTSPVFSSGRNVLGKNFSEFPLDGAAFVNIGNDVWIGAMALIRDGICIGDGAVIGMGSVVTKDVPPYAVVAGNPAKIIKYRFEETVISEMNKIKWWNFSDDTIWEFSKDINNVNAFIENVKLSDKL